MNNLCQLTPGDNAAYGHATDFYVRRHTRATESSAPVRVGRGDQGLGGGVHGGGGGSQVYDSCVCVCVQKNCKLLQQLTRPSVGLAQLCQHNF